MTSPLSVLLLLGILCFSFTSAEDLFDCCLKTSDKRFPSKNIKSFIIQEAGKGCPISATVIITKTERKLCLDPPKDNTQIQEMIRRFQQREEQKVEKHKTGERVSF